MCSCLLNVILSRIINIKVMNLTRQFSEGKSSKALIIMGSGSDLKHCRDIETAAKKFALQTELRVSSAHKVFTV